MQLSTEKKTKIEIAVLAGLLLAFLGCAAAYAIKEFFLFPFVCGAILVSHLFLFHGKYRIYAFLFYAPLSKFMIPNNIHIGSILTWAALLYALVIWIDYIRDKRTFPNSFAKRTLVLAIFFVIVLVGALLSIGSFSPLKLFSLLLYLALIALFCADFKASKNFTVIVFALIAGYFVSNAIAAVFVYLLRSYSVEFLTRFAGEIYAQQWTSAVLSFRFPGLCGDPNYNGAHALLILAMVAVSYRRMRYWPLALAFALLIQAFPIIGASKAYLLSLGVLAVFLVFYYIPKRNMAVFWFCAILAVGVFLLVAVSSGLSDTLRRFLSMDTREGFFNALTTQRTTILERYYSAFMKDPLRWLFGHGGTEATLDNSFVAHSFLTSAVWNYGILGFCAFLWYFITFVPSDYLTSCRQKITWGLPCLMIFIVGLGLELAQDEMVFLSYFAFCLLAKQPLLPKRKKSEGQIAYDGGSAA